MAAIPPIKDAELQAICDIIGDTGVGLTGTEIALMLERAGINDPESTITKRKRLFAALKMKQDADRCANNVLGFLQHVMEPVRYTQNRSQFDYFKGELNRVLSFCGYEITDSGKIATAVKVSTLDEAERKADRLKVELRRRGVHPDVIKFCQAELLQENYFHAVFEATKSVAEKIRNRTGLTGDGADIVDRAFGLSNPLLAINSLRTETEQSEQRGFSNLVKGMFGTFRNVTGHAPKINWIIDEQDAMDLLTIVSLLHRRLDSAIDIPRQPGKSDGLG